MKPYAVVLAIALSAALIAPADAQMRRSGSSGTIEPYTAQTIEPYKAETIQPYQAETIQPHKADTIQPFKAGEVTPVPSQPVYPKNPPPAGFDSRLVGKWRLKVPGAAWTDRLDHGSYVVDRTHVSTGAPSGILEVGSKGDYVWRYPNGSLRSKGRIRGGYPDQRWVSRGDLGKVFWVISDGRNDVFIRLNDANAIGICTNSYTFSWEGVRGK